MELEHEGIYMDTSKSRKVASILGLTEQIWRWEGKFFIVISSPSEWKEQT